MSDCLEVGLLPIANKLCVVELTKLRHISAAGSVISAGRLGKTVSATLV